MTKINEVYKCLICGNIVEVLHSGGGTLVCCGQEMKLMEENSDEEASLEKHLPVIKKNKDGVVVSVGEIMHPMEEKHFIEWIEIITEKGTGKKFLKPGKKPEAKFPVKSEIISARAYCNLHGLWRKELEE